MHARRGAFFDGVDFAMGSFIVIAMVMLILVMNRCDKAAGEERLKVPISDLEDAHELLVLMRTPITYEGTSQQFADLFERYYYDQKGRGKLKEFLQDELEAYIDRTGKGKKCWNVYAKVEDKDVLVDLWDKCEWTPLFENMCEKDPKRFMPRQRTVLPLLPGAADTHLTIYYGTDLQGVCRRK